MNLFVKPADGNSEERRLLEPGASDRVVSDWTRDGRYLIYFEGTSAGALDIFALPLQGNQKPFPVIATPFFDTNGVVSPDGKWIAYNSNPTGRAEIYVSRFPQGTGKWQVSAGGGDLPRWKQNNQLFFVAPDHTIMRAEVSTKDGGFQSSTPVPLFRSNVSNLSSSFPLDLSSDGKRFLHQQFQRTGLNAHGHRHQLEIRAEEKVALMDEPRRLHATRNTVS